MSKFSNSFLILALLSAFACSASAVAAEKSRTKDKDERSPEAKHEKNTEVQRDKKGPKQDSDKGITAKTSVVTVTNRGGGPLTITAPPTITRLSGSGNFALVNPGAGTPCAASLVVAPDGGECTIGVEYTPSGRGISTARLTLTDSGAATATQETVIRSDD